MIKALVESTTPSPPKYESGAQGVSSKISNGIVQLLRARAGRGPTRAKTLISAELVVVTLGDCLTPLEKSLVGGGEAALVRRTRDLLHHGMREEATAIVESATGRRVVAYLSDQVNDPDLALIAFVLGGDGAEAPRPQSQDSPV